MHINYQKNHIGMLAVVFSLMAITLYMAFAFPFSLLHFKQSDTTQIKAVIIVGRHGDVTPAKEAYFDAYGEEPPQSWFTLGGPDQLTGVGKERMYLLGKFLKLHYYDRLLQGNPRRLYVRAENSDKAQESAQALLAGLNPPRDKWTWFHGADSGAASEIASNWQPKAVHSTAQLYDDLLSSQSKCLLMDSYRATWKNSTRYLQLLNEFRHDLQVLRQNTGLDFEDDLEMLANIEDQLRARSVFDTELGMPSWYTSTLAQRLAHIADVTAGARFSQTGPQRLYAGRLLDTIVKNIFAKIRSDLTSGTSLLNDNNINNSNNNDNNDAKDGDTGDSLNDSADSAATASGGGKSFNLTNSTSGSDNSRPSSASPTRRRQIEDTTLTAIGGSKLLPPDEQIKLKLERQLEPSMYIYMTDKQHLTALLNSLKIYSSQPHYGALLLIELHYDPTNQIHFLRLFTVNSASHNVLPEPVRVNPIACLDAVECSPQRFEKNLRHLTVDKPTWQSLCSNMDKYDNDQLLQPLANPTTTTPTTTITGAEPTSVPTAAPLPSGSFGTLPTNSPLDPASSNSDKTTVASDDKDGGDNQIDDIFGPTERSGARPTSAPIGETSTDRKPATADDVNDSIHLDKLDESLVVGPIKTTTESSSDEANLASEATTTERDGGESTSVPSTTISDSSKLTTMSSGNLEAESTTDSVTEPTTTTTTAATTTTTTAEAASEETTAHNGSGGASTPAGLEEITTTRPASTTVTSKTGLDSVGENDPKTNEIIDENHPSAEWANYIGENDV